MRFFKLIAMFGAVVSAAMFVSPAQAVLVTKTATATSMGAGRENAGFDVDLPKATSSFVQTSNSISANPVEAIVGIDFDVSIPAGQQIDSATLTLHVMNFGSSPAATLIDLPVYALNTSFVPAEMTWNSRETGTTWTTSGAKNSPSDIDGSTESLTTVTIPASGNTPFTWDLKDLIQSQYDAGTLGNGILVGGRTAGGLADNLGTVAFAGWSGAQGAGTQPMLSINYSVAAVPEPSSFAFGFVVLCLGMTASYVRKRRQ